MSTATKARHIPGPWEITEGIFGSVAVIECSPERQIAISAVRRSAMEDERYPNARLIATAPEMLEALEDAARDCGLEASCASKRNDDHMVKAWSELQHRLDAVIRRARGGE